MDRVGFEPTTSAHQHHQKAIPHATMISKAAAAEREPRAQIPHVRHCTSFAMRCMFANLEYVKQTHQIFSRF